MVYKGTTKSSAGNLHYVLTLSPLELEALDGMLNQATQYTPHTSKTSSFITIVKNMHKTMNTVKRAMQEDSIPSEPITDGKVKINQIFDVAKRFYKSIDSQHAGNLLVEEFQQKTRRPNISYVTLSFALHGSLSSERQNRLILVDTKAMRVESMHMGTIDEYERDHALGVERISLRERADYEV